jgi:hypothetical protein
MSSDIEKLAVFDDRIVQTRPKYAVEKGALSLTNSPFSAISQTQSQHTYNIYVPSENVYVARDLDWASTVNLRVDVMLGDSAGGQFPAGQPLLQLGVDGSLASFPLNSLCATMTATINDTTVTINSQDVLTEVLRLTDYRANRVQRTCPTMADKYQQNESALNAQNDPISGYTNAAHDYGEPTNGSWSNIVFTTPTGAVLVGSQSPAYSFDGFDVNTVDGVPVSTVQAGGPSGAGNVNGRYSVFLKWRCAEKLVLSPFVFANEHSEDTGLFGINNIQLVMNMRDPNRSLRLRNSYVNTATKEYYSGPFDYVTGTPTYNALLPPIAYNTNVGSGVFSDSLVNVQFLTPSLDIPLPPKSVVPYMEYPRFITQPQNVVMAPGQTQQLQSQTITLPQIPDLLIIYVKAIADPATTSVDKTFDPALPQFGASYLPLAVSENGARPTNPLSINFDNFSGLLSSHTKEQLYNMSVKNGLDMDWNTWSGLVRVASGAGGSIIPTVGGFLVLKPGVDLTLQSGQAASLVGNFTLQFNISVTNTFPFPVQPQIYVVTANSGFFESIRGSSRIIKGVLSEQDIIGAPLAPAGTRGGLARMIGGKVMAFANRLGMMKGDRSSSERTQKVPVDSKRSEMIVSKRTGSGLASRLM